MVSEDSGGIGREYTWRGSTERGLAFLLNVEYGFGFGFRVGY
jgi:hypothetical protein